MADNLRERYTNGEPDLNYTPWATRNGFSHAGIALIWVVIAFFLFQIIAGLISFALVFWRVAGQIQNVNPTQIMDLLAQHLDLVFIANTTGQVLFLALGTWFFCRLQVRRRNRPHFLRFKFPRNTLPLIGLVFVLMLVVQPAIWFLGWINSFVPVPEFMEQMQFKQMEMIEAYLTGDGLVAVALFNIALVPAVCEEILFRGYLQRSFEKSWGVWISIVISGLIFGAYHLQLTNFLPLSAIGILLAYMTWTTGSIYPAMVAHFVNNGASVLLGKYYPETAFSELTPESMPPVWMIVASVAISAYLIYVLFSNRNNQSISAQGGSYDK